MNHVYLEIMLFFAAIGCGGLGIKASDLIIGILVKKYRSVYFKAGHPTAMNFWDPIQDLINTIFNWKILLKGNYIDKTNNELTQLIFLYRFYYLLALILILIYEMIY